MGTVRDVVNFAVPTTGSLIAAYPTPRAGIYAVCVNIALLVATTVQLLIEWTDATSLQSVNPIDGTVALSVGLYTLAPVSIHAVAGSMITVSASAGEANAVLVSAAIKALDG